jgi:LAS superfamily LD-carboxypeptidase LdcB
MLKRTITLLSVLTTAFSLTACGGHVAEKEEPAKTHQEKQEAKDDATSAQPKKEAQETAKPQNSEGQVKQQKPEEDGAITVIANPQSILALVNKTHKLPDGYTPENLVYPDVLFLSAEMDEKREMRKDAAEALEKLFAAANQAGFKLYGVSGYRSYERQVAVYQHNVEKLGKKKADQISAAPGTSEHQTGLAMDITCEEMLTQPDPLTSDFGNTEAGKWVAQNAHKYGFIIRYPKGKESITGYEYEPWHLRYVGVKAASFIYAHGLTLEEYIDAEKVNRNISDEN